MFSNLKVTPSTTKKLRFRLFGLKVVKVSGLLGKKVKWTPIILYAPKKTSNPGGTFHLLLFLRFWFEFLYYSPSFF